MTRDVAKAADGATAPTPGPWCQNCGDYCHWDDMRGWVSGSNRCRSGPSVGNPHYVVPATKRYLMPAGRPPCPRCGACDGEWCRQGKWPPLPHVYHSERPVT